MSKSKAQETKQNILRVACELFRLRGFEATTMREIADAAGMATGATYYHFRNKEELVFAYYLQMEEEAEDEAQRIASTTKSANKRLLEALRFKFEQMKRDHDIVRALVRVAADPASPLSPLAKETASIRERAIAMLGGLIEGSDLKVGKELRAVLPTILWLYYMVMVFFWAHDRSSDQRHAHRMLDLSSPLLIKLLGLSALPLTAPINRNISQAIGYAMAAADEPSTENFGNA